MGRETIRVALIYVAILTLAATVAMTVWAYPTTAACPYDGGNAISTGNTKPMGQPGCEAVEYEHKGTDYSNPAHPRQFDHIFWEKVCGNQ